MNQLAPAINGNQVTKMIPLGEETLAALVLNGDLSRLKPAQKVEYYQAFCNRVGLDPATQPFRLLTLNGKQILYCDRGGTAQLNKRHEVSHKIVERKREEDIYSVIANASTPDGRQTESIGAVSVMGLKGEALANAMMKAETKAKRRSTLDLLGLGMLDESEIGSLPPGAIQANEAVADNGKPQLPADFQDVPNDKSKREDKGIEIQRQDDAVHAENFPWPDGRPSGDRPYYEEESVRDARPRADDAPPPPPPVQEFGGGPKQSVTHAPELEPSLFDVPSQAAIEKDPDLERAKSNIRKECIRCYSKEDFKKLKILIESHGGIYTDRRVTEIVNRAYLYLFPRTANQQGA